MRCRKGALVLPREQMILEVSIWEVDGIDTTNVTFCGNDN